MRLFVASLAILLTAAGCASTTDDSATPPPTTSSGPTFEPFTPPDPNFDFTTVIDPDHGGHSIPELHTNEHGARLVGYASIQEILPLGVRGSITQVDIHGTLAAVSGMEGGLAFALVDIANPTAPQAVGWYPSSADGWTARFSDDGKYVYYGCQRTTSADPTTLIGGTCLDPEAQTTPLDDKPGGIVAVDVTDPTNPTFVDFLPGPAAHNIQVSEINGTDTIFTNGVQIIQFNRTTNKLGVVAEIGGVHDATSFRHPITGEWLMATGTGELTLYNVDNPANPIPIFEGTGSEGWTGWHEQTVVPGIVDGKVIMLGAGESFAGTGGETLPDVVSVIDITEPSTPRLLGTWQPDFRPVTPWPMYWYSAHEMAATPTGQVAMGWYHGGVWVFDVSDSSRQAAPMTLAALQPHNMFTALPPSTFPQVPVPVVPYVWGAGWDSRGYLIVPDMHTGLYVYEPDWGLIPGLDGGQ